MACVTLVGLDTRACWPDTRDMTTTWTPNAAQGAAHDASVTARETWTNDWLTPDDQRAWREQTG